MGVSTKNLGDFNILPSITLEVHECGVCGVIFGVAEGLMDARRSDHSWWYCPNGHRWRFSRESREEKLERERNEARSSAARERALRDQTEASLRATKGVVTKQRKKLARVKYGVCPCCNRHFENVEAHMEMQHPDFDPLAALPG